MSTPWSVALLLSTLTDQAVSDAGLHQDRVTLCPFQTAFPSPSSATGLLLREANPVSALDSVFSQQHSPHSPDSHPPHRRGNRGPNTLESTFVLIQSMQLHSVSPTKTLGSPKLLQTQEVSPDTAQGLGGGYSEGWGGVFPSLSTSVRVSAPKPLPSPSPEGALPCV